MVSGSELDALKTVNEAGGETVAQTVARKLRVDTTYARLLLNSLARADYLDLLRTGRYRLAWKGERELEKKGLLKPPGEEKAGT